MTQSPYNYNDVAGPQAEHGTRSAYTHLGCRDECCRTAERLYKRQYRARQRQAAGR